jgi:hypothetical protein
MSGRRTRLSDGEYGRRRADTPPYQHPFGCVFSAAIASATFGIARSAIDAYRVWSRPAFESLGHGREGDTEAPVFSFVPGGADAELGSPAREHAEGGDALRALKRRISDAVWRQLHIDARNSR